MNILWFSWKDIDHPKAGGAEQVSHQIAKRAVAAGHSVHFIVGGFSGGDKKIVRDGYTVTRVGNAFSVYWQARTVYRQSYRDWPDLIIEEVNTIPFFTQLYVNQPRLLFFHQLCREIWFYQMVFPINLIGFVIEPWYLRLLSGNNTFTISNSTRQDLARYGFDNVEVLTQGNTTRVLSKPVDKSKGCTFLSLGSVRPMKQTHHQFQAFELVCTRLLAEGCEFDELPKLEIAGDTVGEYGQRLLKEISQSKFAGLITYHGRVSDAKKVELLKAVHFVLFTSVKEGWGLVATEGQAVSTPTIAYDVDGLRDSVQDGKTGFIAQADPESLAQVLYKAYNIDSTKYSQMQRSALTFARKHDFETTYQEFEALLCRLLP